MMLATMPMMAAIPSPAQRKHRIVYDLKNEGMDDLPGTLMREEGKPWKKKDKAAEEAYRHAGYVYDFYKKFFNRNSLDDNGMSLISSVHLRRKHNNAYWNGEQMVYGDGDGRRLIRFTKALDVVGHEFSHGVVTHTCNLEYKNESGALNVAFRGRLRDSGLAMEAEPGCHAIGLEHRQGLHRPGGRYLRAQDLQGREGL